MTISESLLMILAIASLPLAGTIGAIGGVLLSNLFNYLENEDDD